MSTDKNTGWNIHFGLYSPLNIEYALKLQTFYTDVEICIS